MLIANVNVVNAPVVTLKPDPDLKAASLVRSFVSFLHLIHYDINNSFIGLVFFKGFFLVYFMYLVVIQLVVFLFLYLVWPCKIR